MNRNNTTRQRIFRRACLWTGFLTFATIAFGPRPAQAAVTEAWVHRYSNVVGDATDRAVKVVRDAAGDIIVTGTTSGPDGADLVTIKYSGADGSVLWQQRDSGPANGYGQATGLAVDGNGNVVVTGLSSYLPGAEYYTAKYAAADGALLWEKHCNVHMVYSWALANAVAVDGDGNVVVTENSFNGTNIDYYTAKYAAADGTLLWEKRYNGLNIDDYVKAVAVDGSGNVFVTGGSATLKYAAADGALLWEKPVSGHATALDTSGNVVVAGYSAGIGAYTAKYAAGDGALLWEQYGPGVDGTAAVAVDGSGNAVVTGSSGLDYYTAKYAAANGALLWEKRYHGPANSWDYANAVAVDGSGNVVVTGSSGLDYYTAKYAAADGELLWEQRYNGPTNGHDLASAVAVDGSGNVVVTGTSNYRGNGFDGYVGGDYYTAKYSAADGALLWKQRYNGPAPYFASAQAVAVDGSGNVAVTGVAYNRGELGTPEEGDYYTAKYAAANGALLWEKRYDGPANRDDLANALAVDGSGNVVVTGSSDGDYYTAKYAAADGALLWEQRYNGPANGDDIASALAVDGSGNVVVTGSATLKYAAADGALLWKKRYTANDNEGASAVAVDGSGNVVVTGDSNYDYYTAKYAAADGTLLWEKRYNGPANSRDFAGAVAVDSSGNVVVTGTSGGDYYTAKYAAVDGALLWEKRYNGPANGRDWAEAVAVDGSGNVVVTGSSDNVTGADYYTAKYAAANGALLWEKRYNGPAHSYGQATGLAVDGNGNVVVTGSSRFLAVASDYYTAKYAAADGALLWEKRYNSGADFSTSLALGPNGMIAVTGSSSGGYATVVYQEVLPPISIDLVPAGIRLRFSGVPRRQYNLERASSVAGPWSTINTQTAPAAGVLEYLDTNSPGTAALYRASEP